jgi:CelD/BcsL family acetyltransferase involved in cellulose biosynthesis
MDDDRGQQGDADADTRKQMMPYSKVKQSLTSLGDHAPAWDLLNRRQFNPQPLLDSHVADGGHRVDVFLDLDDLPLDVQQLFSKAEQENVEFGLSWYRNLVCAVYPNSGDFRLYVLRKNGRPAAVLPVIVQHRFLGQRIASLSNFYTAIYAPFFETDVTANDVVPLVKAVLKAHSALGSLQFSPMDPASSAYHLLLSALKMTGLPSFRFFCFGNWYLPVTGDWPAYFKNREGILRNTIKRMGNGFSAAGGTLKLVQGGAELEQGIQGYEHVYATSWKQPEPYPNFVPGLMRACAKRGWLRLGIAWLNGEAIAAQIWIVANHKASIYKLAFDEKHKKYAPGTLLTAMLMQHAFESDQVTEVDYLIGDDPYKQSWMSHRRERWGIVAYNPNSISGLLGLGREVLGRSLKPWVSRFETPMPIYKNTSQLTVHNANTGYHWEFLPATEFASISDKWQSLCDRSIRSPLLSADFVAVSLQHFGRGDEMICFAETPTGSIAATILQRKNGVVWETFQASQMPLGPWLQLPQLDFSTVLKSLMRALPLPIMMLGVTQLDTQFFPRPDASTLLTIDSITTGEIDLPDSPELFINSLNSKPFKRRLRKAETEIGPITLICETNPEAISDYVNLYASMESRSWKGSAGTALTPNDPQSNFYVALLRRLAVNSRARMYILKMGERAVAAQIAIAEDDVLYLLKTTYEPDLMNLGPGVMLQYYITLHSYEQTTRIKRIEFYGPLNQSQHMWITGRRTIYHANAYRSELLTTVHRRLMKRPPAD